MTTGFSVRRELRKGFSLRGVCEDRVQCKEGLEKVKCEGVCEKNVEYEWGHKRVECERICVGRVQCVEFSEERVQYQGVLRRRLSLRWSVRRVSV